MLKGQRLILVITSGRPKQIKPVLEDREEPSQNKNNLRISFHMAVPSGPRRGCVLGPLGLSVQKALQVIGKSRIVSFIFTCELHVTIFNEMIMERKLE